MGHAQNWGRGPSLWRQGWQGSHPPQEGQRHLPLLAAERNEVSLLTQDSQRPQRAPQLHLGPTRINTYSQNPKASSWDLGPLEGGGSAYPTEPVFLILWFS